MRRIKAIIFIALAWCFLSANNRAMAQAPSSTFSLELRVANPAVRNGADLVVIVRIGRYGTRALPMSEWNLAGLTQYFNSWRETAMEILLKKLHMA
jgi:aspartate aminotransferase-like enzyme